MYNTQVLWRSGNDDAGKGTVGTEHAYHICSLISSQVSVSKRLLMAGSSRRTGVE